MSQTKRSFYFDELELGQVYRSGPVHVTADAIKVFAAQFDPQPFHLDEELAKASLFGGLAASGWHTAAMTMRMLVDGEFRPAEGTVGAAIDELRWIRPVRPGDTLRIETEVVGKRESQSRPDSGIVQARTTTFNQADEPVQSYVSTILVPKRPKATP